MVFAIIAVVIGLAVLVWSADKFVDGAAGTARFFGMSPLLIGMVIVGFGTSAPEMVVSAFAATNGNAGIALGNAYGSNIANIALILGITALISPITVKSAVLRKEFPILIAITILSAVLLYDLSLSRIDAVILLVVFVLLMTWTVREGLQNKNDALAKEVEKEAKEEEKNNESLSLKMSIVWLIVGLVLLVVSSRLLVWGAVAIAYLFGVSDLIIGLTIVAIGTSLPELASSIAAARKNEHDIALGNVLGSNLFNTLAVVGIAGSIQPFSFPPETIYRDMLVMGIVTLALFFMGISLKKGKNGRINRIEATVLLCTYVAYTVLLISSAITNSL